MSLFNYTAQRHVTSARSAGTQYDLEFSGRVAQPGGSVVKVSNVSLGGQREGIRLRDQTIWTVQPAQIALADIELWEEFLFSVDNWEPFTFDPTGTAASPSSLITRGFLMAEQWEFQRLDIGLDIFRLSTLQILTPT